jgi:hypothetical protein
MMKAKALLRMAEQGGAVVLRNQGDDAIVRFPNGRTARIPKGGKQNEAAKSLICRVQKYLKDSTPAND